MPTDLDQNITRINNKADDVFGTPPTWIIRWGSMLVLMLIAIVLTLSITLKYPETITTKALFTIVNNEKAFNPPHTAKVTDVLYKDNDWVEKNKPLLILKREKDHVDTIKAGLAGRLRAMQLVTEGDQLDENTKLFSIAPAQTSWLIQVELSVAQFSKVKPGQQVIIHGDNALEKPLIAASGKIFTRPEKSGNKYYCSIKLSDDFVTKLNNDLDYMPDSMQGVAKIVISEKPILKKLFPLFN